MTRQHCDATPDTTPVGVFVVDDHPGFVRAVEPVIAATPGFVVVGTAGCGLDALAALDGNDDVSLVLLDVHLPDISGIAVAERYGASGGRATVILMSTADLADLPAAATGTAVAGFIPKESLSTTELQRVWVRTRAMPLPN